MWQFGVTGVLGQGGEVQAEGLQGLWRGPYRGGVPAAGVQYPARFLQRGIGVAEVVQNPVRD